LADHLGGRESGRCLFYPAPGTHVKAWPEEATAAVYCEFNASFHQIDALAGSLIVWLAEFPEGRHLEQALVAFAPSDLSATELAEASSRLAAALSALADCGMVRTSPSSRR